MGMAEMEEVQTPTRTSTSRFLTFLIADVRGYTRFTDEHGDEAAARLADRFASLCETVIAAHEGQVIELRGDEALCVFSSPRLALRGAVALQEAFAAATQVDPSFPLGVGMGLDAGEPVPVRGGYRGGVLNLAARLCSIARAGEILVSETVAALARKTEGLVFVDRGPVILKGLTAPVRALQIAREGALPDSLPPLQPILVTHPTNLPDDATPFIGREAEIAAVAGRLRHPRIRLVTLTGPGGTGKTRLALQMGNTLLYDFPDGVFFCDLAPLTDPTLVPSIIARVLDIKEEGGRELTETLIERLKERQVLLILDNFEHLLDAGHVVADLLDACRDLHILVTSRIPLHLSREHEYAVPPLSVPDPSAIRDVFNLTQYESVTLFIQRAQAARDSFSVTSENAPAIADICVRLDGLPLAIELAAARVKVLPPKALLQRLDSRLKLLTGGAKDRHTRQQTLRNTIDWSYSLLTKEEQTLFARLSVFAGGWTFEAAGAVCNPNGELDILEGMTSLVDKSLIRQEGQEEPRFSGLETIREYAVEKLAEREEADAVAQCHADYYIALTEEIEKALPADVRRELVRHLHRDVNNIRAALAWTVHNLHIERGLRLATSLRAFWWNHGYFAEWRTWLERLLAIGISEDVTLQARALEQAARACAVQGDFDAAVMFGEKGLRLYETAGDRHGRIQALNALGLAHSLRGNAHEALELLRETARESRLAGHPDIGPLITLGYSLIMYGEIEEGLDVSEEALVLARARGDWGAETSILDSVARGRLEQGELSEAEQTWREGLLLMRRMTDLHALPFYLEGLAALAARQSQGSRSSRLFAAATKVRDTTGAILSARDQAARDRDLSEAQLRLSADDWQRAWAEGQAMSVEEAVTYALELEPEPH